MNTKIYIMINNLIVKIIKIFMMNIFNIIYVALIIMIDLDL